MAEQQLSAPARAQQAVRRAGVTHIRHRHTDRFTVVGNHLSQHRELSLTAIGLAVHIQSLPDGALISIKSLLARFPEGEVTIARALRELEAHGYLARLRERTADGRRVTRTYAYDHPQARTAAPQGTPPASPRPPEAPAPPPAPAPTPTPVPETAIARRAADVLAALRGRDPRLLLTRHDVRRLVPDLIAWLERGVETEVVLRTLSADIPGDAIRRPAGLLAYRLKNWLPPALPAALPPPSAPSDSPTASARPRPHPFQTCDGCERAFRAPEPGGLCRDCGTSAEPPPCAGADDVAA